MGCRPSTPKSGAATSPEPSIEEQDDDEKSKGRMYRPSIDDLQPPDPQDDLSSEAMSVYNKINGTPSLPNQLKNYGISYLDKLLGTNEESADQDSQEKEHLCQTEVTLQWLVQAIGDRFDKALEGEPRWIVERLNRPQIDELANATVMRVTFGWEDPALPKNVIVKTIPFKDLRDDEESKFALVKFKRECVVYEWVDSVKHKFDQLAAPTIYHIKKQTKEITGVIVMEDASEKGIQHDSYKELPVELVRDLMRQLAYLHTASTQRTDHIATITELPPLYYTHLTAHYDEMMSFFERHDVDHSRFVYTVQYWKPEYLHEMFENASDKYPPRVLLHGDPFASNIFRRLDNREKVLTIFDWTGCHSGCYGEDLAKAICWNLSTKDRLECTTSLLEEYYNHVMKYAGNLELTMNDIRKAYDAFVPVAMVTFTAKIMAMRNKGDIESLLERAKGLIENIYTLIKLDE